MRNWKFNHISYLQNTLCKNFVTFSSHIVGGVIGSTTGVLLAIGSYFDLSIRCTMALIFPRYYISNLNGYWINNSYALKHFVQCV